jgi:hypothetical protein
MAKRPQTVTLSHEELAVLDLVIMRALQRGVSPTEPLAFIDSVVNAVTDAANSVTDAAQQAVNFVTQHTDQIVQAADVATQVAEVAAEVAAAIGFDKAHVPFATVQAVKGTITATAKAPTLTLEQLIAIRRAAVEAQQK